VDAFQAVALEPFTSGAAGSILWRSAGEPRLSVIVKATYALVPGGVMTPRPGGRLVEGDVHEAGDPRRPLVAASDRVLYRPAADVFVVGAPPARRPARLVVRRGGATVLDKAQPDTTGFGPVARAWPARAGMVPPGVVDARVPALGEGFDWSYFHAAPPDQRVPFLHGDEEILLEGLHPGAARLATRLPGSRAMGRVLGLPRGTRKLDFSADGLCIDVVSQTCTLTFRSVVPIDREVDLAAARLMVGLDHGQPIPEGTVPLTGDALRMAAAPAEMLPFDRNARPQIPEGTVDLSHRLPSDSLEKTLQIGPHHDADAPFSIAKPGTAPPSVEPPWVRPAAPAPRPSIDLERTLYIPPAEPEPEVIEIEPDAVEEPAAAASPWAPQPASEIAAPPPRAPLPRTRHVPLPDLNEALYSSFPTGRR
jgi:hypothetical protein